MIMTSLLEPGHEKMCLMSYANNKGADQPAHPHPRSLISAFVIHCLDNLMSLVSVTKISSLMLASVAEQASLSLTWSETHEDTFSHEAHMGFGSPEYFQSFNLLWNLNEKRNMDIVIPARFFITIDNLTIIHQRFYTYICIWTKLLETVMWNETQ